MDKRCVIIGGAPISDYNRIKEYINTEDFYVYCDSGLKHKDSLNITPNLIIGDFDSHPDPKLDIETITLPTVKDDTDTMFAVKECISRGFKNFILIGVSGGRPDHTFANVYILMYLSDYEKNGIIIDDYCEMELVKSEPVRVSDDFSFFSLFNITGTAKGINITGAKYPLKDAEIKCDFQYGISNEVLPGQTSEICVKEGELLLMRIF